MKNVTGITGKRILHVIVSMDPAAGGLPQAVKLIVSGLNEKGISSEIVCLDAPSDSFLNDLPHTVHVMGPRKGPWGYASKLQPFLVDNFERFDTIILHGLWQYTGYAIKSALSRYLKKHSNSSSPKVPSFLIMPHGMLDPYFQKAKDRKIKAIRNWLFWKFIEKDIIRCADGILFTCEEELLLAQHTFSPYQPAKETVVGLGIPPAQINDRSDAAFFSKCPLALNQQYILFMGRIHIKKGVDLLIEAYEQLLVATKEQGSTPLPKLLIAGPGWNSDFGKKVFADANRSAILKDNIIVSDILGQDEKWGALRNCEAFILASHQENYGIAIVEALSVGKPVLISDKINIWREIKHGNGGFVANDDVSGTRKNLSTWFSLSEHEKQTMSQSAKSTFEQYFSLTKATEKLAAAL